MQQARQDQEKKKRKRKGKKRERDAGEISARSRSLLLQPEQSPRAGGSLPALLPAPWGRRSPLPAGMLLAVLTGQTPALASLSSPPVSPARRALAVPAASPGEHTS